LYPRKPAETQLTEKAMASLTFEIYHTNETARINTRLPLNPYCVSSLIGRVLSILKTENTS